MTEDGYRHIATKRCERHPPPPLNFGQRVRKWLGKSYYYKQGVWCDCPAQTVQVLPPFDLRPPPESESGAGW